MNFYIYTIGCKVNKYESQLILELLCQNKYEIAKNPEQADITIVNSCTVTSVSDSKVMKLLRRIKRENPKTILILTGCLPQAFPNEKDKFSIADIVMGNKCKKDIINLINQHLSTGEKVFKIDTHNKNDKFESGKVHTFNERTRAFIKIQDGCNRFCSYCIIPFSRGDIRSKPISELEQEVLELANKGYKEIVLVGINLSTYGQEFNIDIADACKVVCSINGIERVRLGSLEPFRMDNETIKKLAQEEKFCPQFHISLQSGSDKTLKQMNRQYTSGEYFEIITNIRNAFENASITTDVMVGFPDESDEDFNNSLEFVKKVGFAKVHVFAYSRRKGTVADKMENQIPQNIKEQRSKKMISATNLTTNEFLKSQIGKTSQVIFETYKNNGTAQGYTKNYTKVSVKTDEDLTGQIKNVKIIDVENDICNAQILFN